MASILHSLSVGADRRTIACLVDDGALPAVVWLGGFRSDMAGTKAEALAEWGQATGRRVVRFDYSGHGASGGDFTDGTISRWTEEALAVLDAFAGDRFILVGSSMGGWITLLAVRALGAAGKADQLAGVVLVAPAPDFTERLMLPAFTPAMRLALAQDGVTALSNGEGAEPTPITRGLIEDGRANLLLDGEIRIDAPVHILQGMKDTAVPHGHALLLVDRLVHDDVVVTLIKDGDHRLSRPEDIERLLAAVASIAGLV